MNRRKFRITFALAAILLTAGAFLLISLSSNMTGSRLDMTSDKLFTMSPAAATILKNLDVPVQVKLYITPTEKMPTQYRDLERDITEQLRNFEQVSDGMLKFDIFNPQDDPEMQQMLTTKGISPFQVQSVEKDEMGIKRIWSAITISYKEKPEELMPRILPGNLAALEQDIIGPIHRLTRKGTPKIAIFAPKKPIDQQLAMQYLQQGMQPPPPSDMYTNLPKLFDQGHYESVLVELTEQSPIPQDADLLVVMATSELNQRQVYEINRALNGGMPVIMAVAPHEYAYSPGPRGVWNVSGSDVNTGLEPMLQQFGLQIMEDHFMDANMETIELPREVNMGGLRMQTRDPVRMPMQIRVTETQMNQDSPITNRVSGLFALWATPVISDTNKMDQLDLSVTKLINSSDNTWSAPFSRGMLPATALNPNGQAKLGTMPLAVLVEGQFPDTFLGQEAPAWPPADPSAEAAPAIPTNPLPVTPQPGSLVLFGSAKMFDDNILTATQNALLLLNAVDYLAGSRELLAIRSKTLTSRVIRPVEAGEKLAWRFVVTLFVPILLAIFGLIRAGMRRKEATLYRQQVTGGFRP